MSVLEDDIMRYFTGEDEALLRIAERCEGGLRRYTRSITQLDRSLERDDVVSRITEVVWRALSSEKIRTAGMLYRRVVWDVVHMLRRMPDNVRHVLLNEETEEAVVDDEEMFLLRYELRAAVDRLNVAPRERRAARMLVECRPRSEITATCGYTDGSFRKALSRTIYPKLREALACG